MNMKYFFILSGGCLIAWALYGLRQANRNLIRDYERCAGELQEIAGELQVFVAAITAEMEAEAVKLQELMAQASRIRNEVSPMLGLTPVARKEMVNVPYQEPIQLAEHAEKKQRRTTCRNSNIVADEVKYQRVLDLAAAGWPDGEIAKETGIGKGEVQLILQLRK
jgi:hypothetical protein